MEKTRPGDLTLNCAFTVTSADTDIVARLRPGALLNFLIQSAIQSADALGFGFGGLQKEQLFWVLSRVTIHINRPLKWYDNLEVETWPKDIDGLLYIRDFNLRDSRQQLVASATSGWLAVNIKTKRPAIIEDIQATILDRLKMKHAIDTRPEKIKGFDPEMESERRTTYFDIDLNKHVTSTRYLDWMLDLIPAEFLQSHYPSVISINYIKEIALGDSILIYSSRNSFNTFLFEGFNKTKEQISFRGRIEFSVF